MTTYIDTQSDRSYTEGKSNEPLTDIYSTVSGNKYSFIGEGIYERKVTKKSRLSAGVKYQQSLADNTYGGNESSETKMHETHATAYVEYSGKMDRFNYSFGLQGSYSRFKQKEEGYNRYSLLPRLRLGYQFSDNVFVRYRGQISRKSPGLSDMGNVRQLIDSLQVRSGNPELKIFTVYKMSWRQISGKVCLVVIFICRISISTGLSWKKPYEIRITVLSVPMPIS